MHRRIPQSDRCGFAVLSNSTISGSAFSGPKAPFEDGGQGILDATAGRDRFRGGADTGSFRVAGLSAIGWDVDPIEYDTTQHTNLDTYERILPEDAIPSVTAIAALAWHLANVEQLPRFTKDQMPPAGR